MTPATTKGPVRPVAGPKEIIMPRFNPLSLDNAQGKAAELLGAVKGKFGKVPNILGTMAQSPAVLDAYLAFSKSLGAGRLSAVQREQIALAVAGASSCDYCAAAHTAAGGSLGVAAAELHRNLDDPARVLAAG